MIHSTCAICGKKVVRKKQTKDVKLHFCGLECKAEWQRRQRPVTVEWLRQKYVGDGLDCVQIAALVHRDPKSVWNWLRGSNIKTRPRGMNHVLLPKDGSAFRGKKHSNESKEKIRAARLADGHVPYLRNGVHHLKGKHGEATPNWKGGITPERQGFYASDEWKLACVKVWQRDDAKCQRCGLDHRLIDRTLIKFHVHHIVSFKVRELRAEVSNLALLCDKCHRWVHSRANVNQDFIMEPPCQ